MAAKLDDATIRERAQTLTGWTTDGQSLKITRKFKDFWQLWLL